MHLRIDEKYYIRPGTFADAVDLARYGNNKEIAKNLRDSFPYPLTEHDVQLWLAESISQVLPTKLVIANAEEAIGSIGLKEQGGMQCHAAELGYWLAQPFWNRGIMSKAIPLMINYGFKEMQLQRIFAYVFEWNPASAHILEKSGFKKEGTLRKDIIKNGRLLDQSVYGLLKDEWPGKHPEH
ncbi:MAG: N-acetyltransferase [Calditrichaeota bacterium]|nr:MAG: N-acetyltransferase [Calditrichota bacterium]